LSNLNPNYTNPSVKLLTNCESRFFQRPDDCVIKGYDKQAEKDLSSPNSFLSNFEPLTRDKVKDIKEDSIGFDHYTQPVKDLINRFLESDKPDYLVVPSEPRLVNGVPSQNPRYLQTRPDLVNPIDKYLVETCTRIFRKIPSQYPLYLPVNAVLPEDETIRPIQKTMFRRWPFTTRSTIRNCPSCLSISCAALPGNRHLQPDLVRKAH
jgi:hypothetical protein